MKGDLNMRSIKINSSVIFNDNINKNQSGLSKSFLFTNILANIGFTSFLITIPIKIQADLFYYSHGVYPSFTIARHIFYLAALIFFAMAYINIKKDKTGFVIIKNMSILALVVLFQSFFLSILQGKLPLITIKNLYFMFSPILLAYFVVNILDEKRIERLLKVTFIFVVIQYIHLKLPIILTPSSFLEIDFMRSYSPFESSAFSGYFYGFMVYFTLVSKSRTFSVLSVLFNILIFKRLNVIFSVIFLVYSIFKIGPKKVNPLIRKGLMIFFVIFPIVEYYVVINPYHLNLIAQKIGFDNVHGLVMGRDVFIKTVLNSGYKSWGFGSMGERLNLLLGKKGIEFDSVQIFIELGVIGCTVFPYFLWKSTTLNIAGITLMLVLFINISTSHQLTESYTILFNFLTIFLLNKKMHIEREVMLIN